MGHVSDNFQIIVRHLAQPALPLLACARSGVGDAVSGPIQWFEEEVAEDSPPTVVKEEQRGTSCASRPRVDQRANVTVDHGVVRCYVQGG